MKEFKNFLYQGPSIIRIDESQIPYVLFTSDLHLHHKNILHFTQRMSFDGINDIDSMETTFISNINNAIQNKVNINNENDLNKIILFNCGDLIFGSSSNSYDFYKKFRNNLLPIKCYNVIGNHDVNNILRSCILVAPLDNNKELISIDKYVPIWVWNTMYIIEIYRGAQCIAIFTVSHYPLDDFYGSINIHGHLHTIEDLNNYKGKDIEIAKKLRDNGHYIDVGVDRWKGQPVWLSDILENKTDVQINKIPQLTSLKWRYEKI